MAAIVNIRNPWARRALVIVVTVPCLLIALVWGAVAGAAEHVSDICGGIAVAWAGGRKARTREWIVDLEYGKEQDS